MMEITGQEMSAPSCFPPSRMRGGGGRRNRPRRSRRRRRDGRGDCGGDEVERGDTGCRSNRAAHRLLSVLEDSAFVARVVQAFRRNVDNEDDPPSRSSLSSSNDQNDHRSCGHLRPWPVVCNERCGSWYGHPFSSAGNCNGMMNGLPIPNPGVRSCYFKSTDGHVGTWNFSLKRLNLQFLETACRAGGCIIVDATKDRDKTMPDSFSRTIPIWCAVMNGAALRLRRAAMGEKFGEKVEFEYCYSRWRELHSPRCSVPRSEHEHIEGLIDGMVDALLSSGAIKDRSLLVKTLGNSPLRPYWITRSAGDGEEEGGDSIEAVRLAAEGGGGSNAHYTPLVCVSCSEQCGTVWRDGALVLNNNDQDGGVGCGGFWYTQGGADDHEAWSRGLTPKLFWRNVSAILGPEFAEAMEGTTSASCEPAIYMRRVIDEGTVDNAIDEVVRTARSIDEECWMYVDDDDDVDLHDGVDCRSNDRIVATGTTASPCSSGPTAAPPPKPLPYDTLGGSGISVGSRRAGRPPECWEHFDAILNVTTVEYDDHRNQNRKGGGFRGRHYYLQIPVKEGKGDRTELERWMAVALVFVARHSSDGGRVLIHCAQGRDRSVAVAICALVLFCDLGIGGGGGGGEATEGDGEDCSFSPLSPSSLELRPWCRGLYPSLLARVTGDDDGSGCGEVVLGGWGHGDGPTTDDPHRDGGIFSNHEDDKGDDCLHRNSGMNAILVESLLGRDGRNLLLEEIRRLTAGGRGIARNAAASTCASTTEEDSSSAALTCVATPATLDPTTSSEREASSYPRPHPALATKESVRSALHAVQQYRPRACPSRHTMKKVHRCLLSGEYEG